LHDLTGVEIFQFYSELFRATLKNVEKTNLNNDGIVDILDLEIILEAFGSKHGNINWVDKADVNDDGVINILDGAKVARNYGVYVSPPFFPGD
jgi:hypothetical protein